MLVGRRPFAVPSKQWLSLPSCAIERAAQSSEERDRLQVQFSDLHCHAHLAYVDRVGGDESPPVSAAAWSFLTDSLLVAPDSRRLDSGDLRRARSHPFLRGIDWDALLAGCLPPVDIDRTAGHLHLTDSAEADSDSEVDSRLTAEQQMLFEGF